MNDPPHPPRERRTVFVLAGLILAAIVSISFYHLDRHPAFFSPSDEFVDQIDEHESGVVFAHDPVALAALEQRHDELRAALVPLTVWPPEGTLFAFGSVPRHITDANFELVADEAVWSLYRPPDGQRLPLFATATVETIRPGDDAETCPRVTGGARQCGDPGWTRMGPRELTIEGDDQRCIWAHPIDGTTLRFRFPDVETIGDDDRRLHIETALRDAAVGTGVPVDFKLTIDSQSRSHRHDDTEGWQSTRLPAVDDADELAIEVTARESGRRHVCFRFEYR